MKTSIRFFSKLLTAIVLIFSCVVLLLPIVFTITNSFMSSFEVHIRYTRDIVPSNNFDTETSARLHFANMSFIPSVVTLKQYFNLLFKQPLYLNLFWNSVKITVPVVLGQMLIAAPAAYAFEFTKLKYKEAVFLGYIVIMLMPMQVLLVPNYFMANFLGIEKSYLAIILPAIFSPFGVFLIRQYLKGMPYEYIEAAKIDGASQIIIFRMIVLPLIMPAITALSILLFVEYWNLVDQAVIFISESWREPLSVYLSRLVDNDFSMIFAAACFYMFPTVLIFLYGQEYLIEGIQLTGMK